VLVLIEAHRPPEEITAGGARETESRNFTTLVLCGTYKASTERIGAWDGDTQSRPDDLLSVPFAVDAGVGCWI